MPDLYGYENKKYDVIMFNMGTMYDWDHGVINRNYNILKTLTREDKIHRIISVDFFPVTIKKAIKHYYQNILLEIKNAEMIYGDLTSACYQKTEKIYVYSSIDSLFSWKTVARELQRIEKILNLRNVIFWSYNPMFTEFIGQLNEKLFVFDAVDNWCEHPEYPKLMSRNKLMENYKVIAQKADLIFTVSQQMHDFFVSLGRTKDTYWIPNGVDLEHFNNAALIEQQTALSNVNQKIIGYVGTIEDRFDVDIIVKIAQDHSDKLIVLAGPIWKGMEHEINQKLKHLPNILFTGRIPYSVAPAFFNKFDVGIIPHKINKFVDSMNPLKLYEYFAAGIPIVTTPVAGTEIFENKIYVADTAEAFSQSITTALNEDNEQLKAQRLEEAKRYSWHARVNDMVDEISLKLDWK